MDNLDIEQFYEIKTMDEWIEEGKKRQRELDRLFVHDKELGYLTIKVAYPYHIELCRIPDRPALLSWVLHLCEKDWMTTELLSEFMERVAKIKGWNLHSSV